MFSDRGKRWEILSGIEGGRLGIGDCSSNKSIGSGAVHNEGTCAYSFRVYHSIKGLKSGLTSGGVLHFFDLLKISFYALQFFADGMF